MVMVIVVVVSYREDSGQASIASTNTLGLLCVCYEGSGDR
jgi:hypothetical protein